MKPTAELTDMLTGGSSSTEVADKIKDLLYAKASEKIDAFRPQVADNLFGEPEQEEEGEASAEVETEVGDESETPVDVEASAETDTEETVSNEEEEE
jgi:predicted transcriptional regulator|tara:strand:+ start:72 stop:362 length:291 start_codon:yes stop_codon:yes gene_type:complete